PEGALVQRGSLGLERSRREQQCAGEESASKRRYSHECPPFRVLVGCRRRLQRPRRQRIWYPRHARSVPHTVSDSSGVRRFSSTAAPIACTIRWYIALPFSAVAAVGYPTTPAPPVGGLGSRSRM